MTYFKMKFNFKKYPNLDLDLSSIIKIPLIKNNKVIGVITNYNIDTEELLGYIFDDITFNISTKDYKTILSMEIFTQIEKIQFDKNIILIN